MFQSVEKVSGAEALLHDALDDVPVEVVGHAVAEVEPDAAAARRQHVRQHAAVVVDNAVRRRREHVGDDVAALEQREDRTHRRDRLTDVDHHRQIEGRGHFLGAPQHLEIVGAGDVVRQPRLDADDDVAVARDGVARRRTSARLDVHRVAVGQDAGAPDVDQDAAEVRRRLGDGDRLVDAIRPVRSRVDDPVTPSAGRAPDLP